MINPYDLGTFQLADAAQKVNIDDLVRQAKRGLKLRLVEAHIEALGINVDLTTSSTRFKGERLWFVCPLCEKRVGTLYNLVGKAVGCRLCLGIEYRKQRYKGMVEANLM